MNLKKIIAVSALSAVLGVSTLSQAVSVNAEVAETGVYCSNGMSGITVYAYEHFGLELGTMHLYVKGRTAYNDFKTSRYCSPYLGVGFDPYNFSYAGSAYLYKRAGEMVIAKKTGGLSDSAYGFANITYK
ncbi:hypothetical protein [[Clostridium] polysaccharolyticum]|uniref:Uncharacterized protein n=1 Tax=[Clostridium] polysaccharolyticum TaxID=29364 RepID=A0A1I0DE16_9FIRM|nr:hypothetical protein [[Clostridium] polysaccharolyticum]SET30612.1 hypothetical protein SAMN04487772_11429 [[Clostridium] polysaccharolyticum]